MTIRLCYEPTTIYPAGQASHFVIGRDRFLAEADTREEAEQAKRALELVLAPRFTRDEAIAIVLETMPEPVDQACEHHLRGIRFALEALAAAGVFSDCNPAARCNEPDVCVRAMADLLDAAGIK